MNKYFIKKCPPESENSNSDNYDDVISHFVGNLIAG